jgi:hypothetical protein
VLRSLQGMSLESVSSGIAADRNRLEAPGRSTGRASLRSTVARGARSLRCSRLCRSLGGALLPRCLRRPGRVERPAPSIPTRRCPFHGAYTPSQRGVDATLEHHPGGTERGRALRGSRATVSRAKRGERRKSQPGTRAQRARPERLPEQAPQRATEGSDVRSAASPGTRSARGLSSGHCRRYRFGLHLPTTVTTHDHLTDR